MFSAKLGYWAGGPIPPQGLYLLQGTKNTNPFANNNRAFNTNTIGVSNSWNNYATPTPTLSMIDTVYANNLFVSYCGQGGYFSGERTIVTSPDGATWTGVNPVVSSGVYIGYAYIIFALVHDGTKFIGYGLYDPTVPIYEGSNLTSTDGITWTPAVNSTGAIKQFKKVIYQEGIYVGIGTSSAGNSIIASSTNGTTWTLRQTAPANITFYDIIYGNGRFVVVSNISSSAAAATGYYSDDGITWNSMTMPSKINYSCGAYGNSVYVVLSTSGTNVVAVSSDGITWNAYSLNAMYLAVGWKSMIYAQNNFIAVGTYPPSPFTSYAMTSSNGITWATSGTIINGCKAVSSIVYAPPP